MLLYILLFQDITLPTDIVLPDKFDISPTNVYGWLVWGLVGFVTYLKIESSLKSWTIRKRDQTIAAKDKHIADLNQKLIEAEKNSITVEEAELYKKILSFNPEPKQLNESNSL